MSSYTLSTHLEYTACSDTYADTQIVTLTVIQYIPAHECKNRAFVQKTLSTKIQYPF